MEQREKEREKACAGEQGSNNYYIITVTQQSKQSQGNSQSVK